MATLVLDISKPAGNGADRAVAVIEFLMNAFDTSARGLRIAVEAVNEIAIAKTDNGLATLYRQSLRGDSVNPAALKSL